MSQVLECMSFSNNGFRHRIQQKMIDDKQFGFNRILSESKRRVLLVFESKLETLS